MMGNFSELCEITVNEDHTRCLKAAIDIIPGEVIVRDLPVLIIPNWESENTKCSNCLKESFIMCQKCLVFPMCIECKEHDTFDCEFFQRADRISKDLLIYNYSIYGPLKCLLGLENTKTCNPGIKKLLELDAHLDEYKRSELWHEQQSKIIKPLIESGVSEFCQNVNVNEELLERICSIMELNAFDVVNTDGSSLKAIYLKAAQIPHSCIPNTTVSIDSDFNLKVYATNPIQQGSLVVSSYANLLMGTSQRQHYLKMTRYINCCCPRCKDPTELGTYISSLKCKKCPEGYVSHYNANWVCGKCSFAISEEVVNKLIASTLETIFQVNADISEYERLLTEFSSEFHPNHFLIIEIKQNIATILRTVLMDPIYQPDKYILKRKIQLCEDMLPIVMAVQPGISKMYAIALYEFVISFLELAENEYNDNGITPEEFKETLLKAQNILQEAVQHLVHELEKSPEGQLKQRIEIELKRIADNSLTVHIS